MQREPLIIYLIIIIILLPLLLTPPGAAAMGIVSGETEPVDIYFFWGEVCPYCDLAKPFLEEITSLNPQVTVHAFEVYNNAQNRDLFFNFCEAYGIEPQAVPTFFIAERSWIGYNDTIRDEMSRVVAQCLASPCQSPGRELLAPIFEQESDPTADSVMIMTPTPQERAQNEDTEQTRGFLSGGYMTYALMIIGGVFVVGLLIRIIGRVVMYK